MGRVQGGARAAFATPSWGPSRILILNRAFGDKPLFSIFVRVGSTK